MTRQGAGGVPPPAGSRSALACAVFTIVWCTASAEPGAAAGCGAPGTRLFSTVQLSSPASGPPTDRSPANTLGSFQVGTKAAYGCDPGYVLVGERTRSCLPGGRWNGATPACYLNVAETSSLATTHKSLVDGDLQSYGDLQDIFAFGRKLQVDLYFVFRLLEIRIRTHHNFRGYKLRITIDSGINSTPTSTVTIEKSQRLKQPNSWEHVISLAGTVLTKIEATRFRLAILDSDGYPLRASVDGPQWKLYEMQIVANSTGLSWRQCLKDVDRINIATTWAAGNRCYHLVNDEENAEGAEERCYNLGSGGALFHNESYSLYRMLTDVLEDHSPPDLFWVSSEERSRGLRALGASRGRKCSAVRRRSFGWRRANINCDEKHRFVCQRDARVCGSPAQKAALLYHAPQPSVQGANITVTCGPPLHGRGQIQCRPPHWTWTQAISCSARAGRVTNYLGAIIGGAVGGALLLAAVAVTIYNTLRHGADKPATEQYDNIEFCELNRNPIYESSQEDHLYSELEGPEAIYEEPSFTNSSRLTLVSAAPPAVPSCRPSLNDSWPPTLAPPPAGQHNPSASADAGPAGTPPNGALTWKAAPPPASTQTAAQHTVTRNAEYSVPLVDGQVTGGRAGDSSIGQEPTDVATSKPHGQRSGVQGGTGEYATPYDSKDETRTVSSMAGVVMTYPMRGERDDRERDGERDDRERDGERDDRERDDRERDGERDDRERDGERDDRERDDRERDGERDDRERDGERDDRAN